MDIVRSAACVLLALILVNMLTSSFQNDDYPENRDIPDNIKLFVASFESRVNEKIDNELRRQLTQIRARIDYRIPSLLDLTLNDKIRSGFINKAMDDALVRRVETLEKEVATINDQHEGNMTELAEIKIRLQEAEATTQDLRSEIEVLKKANIETTSTFRTVNETFDVIELDMGKLSGAVQNLTSELLSVKDQGISATSELEELQNRLQIINETVNGTFVNDVDAVQNLAMIEAELSGIREVYNTTTVKLGELETGLETVHVTIDKTNAAVQANKDDIQVHDADLKSWKTVFNTTTLDLEIFNSELDLIKSSVLDITTNKHNIHDVEDELEDLAGSLNITNLNLTELVNGLQSIKAAITKPSVDLVVIRDLKAEVLQIWNTVRNTSMDLDTLSSEFQNLNSHFTQTHSDMNEIREHVDDIAANTMNMKQNWTMAVLAVKEVRHDIQALGSRLSDNVNVTETIDRQMLYLMENCSSLVLNQRQINGQMSDLGAIVNETVAHSIEYHKGISTLNSELESVRQNITKIITNVTESALDTQSEVKKIKMVADTTSASINGFEDKLLLISVRLNSTSSVVARNTGSISSVQSEMSAVRPKVESMRSDASSNRDNIRNMESSLSSISTQLNTVKSGLGSLKKDAKFEVRLSTSKSFSTGSVLKFNKVMYNTGGGYSVTTGQFTATVAGSYLFWANILLHDKQETFEMSMNKNGVRIAATAAITSTSLYFDNMSITTVTELKIGDKVLLKKHSGSGSKVFGHSYSGFGGILIKTK